MQKQVPTKAPARSEAGRRRIVFGLAMGAVAVLAFCWGRSGAQTPAQPAQMPSIGKIIPPAAAPAPPSDYSRRVVAHIYGTVPITREDLGEYLIARFGAERIENFVNRRIIEVACQSRGITVSDAEVEAALQDDLKGLSLSLKDFEGKVLKAYGKSLTEWKEDVLRPKLALTKFCRIEVKVTEDDLKAAFEAHYGDKVECRMLLIPKDTNGSSRHDFDLYDKVRKSDAEFDSAARAQAFAPLAAKGGLFPPIHRNYPEPQLEKEAFSLKPGEVSKLLTLPDGSRAILKCVQHIPRDTTKRLEGEEREKLYREVTEVRLTQMVPQLFKQLRDQANPQIYMKRTLKAEDIERAVRNNMAPPAVMTAPAGPPTGVIPASGQKKQ